MKLKNIFKHFFVISRHRWIVFKLCAKAGIFWRGILHDLSKYSPIEFFEGVKYFKGTYSPIIECKKENGYSKAWLHHKGRNKHHTEYWIDLNAPEKTPIMPYKYTVEMLCDKLAAGIIYQGKNWNKEYPIRYWEKEREKILINKKMEDLVTDFLVQVSEKGIDETVNKKNLKNLYSKYCTN